MAFGEISSPTFYFGTPLYISETNRARKLKFGMVSCKMCPIDDRGRLGRSAAPNFYVGTPPYLVELECENLAARGRLRRSAAPSFYFGTLSITQ